VQIGSVAEATAHWLLFTNKARQNQMTPHFAANAVSISLCDATNEN